VLTDFVINLNSRQVLAGLLEVFAVPPELASGVLTSLDKLDKLTPDEVTQEVIGRGLAASAAAELVGTLTADDAEERLRMALKPSETGMAGLEQVDTLLGLARAQIPAGRITFAPRMVRGLSYYTGPIWEVMAKGGAGSLGGGGRYDHLIEQLGGPDVPAVGSSIGIERLFALLPGTPDGAAAPPGPAGGPLPAHLARPALPLPPP